VRWWNGLGSDRVSASGWEWIQVRKCRMRIRGLLEMLAYQMLARTLR